jgi:hypothetical protein
MSFEETNYSKLTVHCNIILYFPSIFKFILCFDIMYNKMILEKKKEKSYVKNYNVEIRIIM